MIININLQIYEFIIPAEQKFVLKTVLLFKWFFPFLNFNKFIA